MPTKDNVLYVLKRRQTALVFRWVGSRTELFMEHPEDAVKFASMDAAIDFLLKEWSPTMAKEYPVSIVKIRKIPPLPPVAVWEEVPW